MAPPSAPNSHRKQAGRAAAEQAPSSGLTAQPGPARAEASAGFAVARAEPLVEPTPAASWAVVVGHSAGLLTTMRVAEAWLWPDPFADFRASALAASYRRSFTEAPKWDSGAPAFEWDGDRWQINVVGHGLLGSELYLRSRNCRHGVLASLATATVASTAWEYGFEASGVRPSGMDLWFTPLAGVLLGEARYQLFQASHGLSPTLGGVTRLLIDPFGELERYAGTPC